ncbi:AAA family ATPase [Candidatus Peregrinibacteria bacterium CG_4_9_14_0_2_um_filter_53_11]|nr:MAG: AAA family ATPase [Candidatus Peregrinibacteria bacterium CG_4_9_14_0_2_um_filter_53_11]
MKIEINDRFAAAIKLIEDTKVGNLFITGKAGTGKSTLLEYFRENTEKKVVVLAPTGVAALNVRGQTIHSFFLFSPHVTPQMVRDDIPSRKLQTLIMGLDAIIIDEASMVRADLLDCIDTSLRIYRENDEPFGGLKMIFIGDLYQLPPVVASAEEREMFRTQYKSPYFFDAKVLSETKMEIIELEKIYRQKERAFIDILNKVRDNSIEHSDLQVLNKRYIPAYDMSENNFAITLTPTNSAAHAINVQKLRQLKTKTHTFYGELSGDFTSRKIPTDEELEIKVGAQIMLLNNDPAGRWVNGSVGKVISIGFNEEELEDQLVVELSDGKTVTVDKNTWEIFQYSFDQETKTLRADSVGSFRQYPLRLAWAVTIHKSQGKTFDNVVIDIGSGTFAHGQVYVALSRCTNLEGLVLRKPILKRHILMDYRVSQFIERNQRLAE